MEDCHTEIEVPEIGLSILCALAIRPICEVVILNTILQQNVSLGLLE